MSDFSEQAYPRQDLTHRIIAGFFRVHSKLGFGYLEAVYRRALAIELAYLGLQVREEVPFELSYRGVSIGLYRADLVVQSTVR